MHLTMHCICVFRSCIHRSHHSHLSRGCVPESNLMAIHVQIPPAPINATRPRSFILYSATESTCALDTLITAIVIVYVRTSSNFQDTRDRCSPMRADAMGSKPVLHHCIYTLDSSPTAPSHQNAPRSPQVPALVQTAHIHIQVLGPLKHGFDVCQI